MIDNDADTLPVYELEQLAPTGPAILGVVNENIVSNFFNNNPTSIELPSLWRLAKHVHTERSPILLYRSK